MSTINDSDLLLVERNGNLHQITYDQMSTLNDDDILLVERGGVQYKVEAQYISTGPNGLIVPPVEVLTPINGAGITEFDQYEPLSSVITAVGEAGTLAKDTDDIQSVADESAWNESQVWSGGSSSDGYSGYPVTNAFNGDLSNIVYAPIENPLTITLPGGSIPLTSGLRVYAIKAGSQSSFFVNGNDYTSQVGTSAGWHTITGETEITSIGIVNNNVDYTGLYAVEVNGKLLIDAIDDSQVWSSFGTGTHYGVRDWSKAFDGVISTSPNGHAFPNPSQTMTWTPPSPITVNESVVLYGLNDTDSSTYGMKVNGSSSFLPASTGYGQPITIPAADIGGSLSSISLICNASQYGPYLTAVEVDGKLLIDEGIRTRPTTGNKVLSFPTNTNFSRLSVGDVIQNSEFNISHTNSGTISNGNLSISATSNFYVEGLSTVPASGYNNYTELTVDSVSGNSLMGFAVGDASTSIISGLGSYVTYRENGAIIKYPGNQTLGSVASYTAGDVLGIAIDSTNVKFYKNGALQGAYTHGLTGEYFVTGFGANQHYQGTTTTKLTANFGATDFVHTPPTGYSALGTQIIAIEADATPPTITVSGGTWDTTNQSQVWSNWSAETGSLYLDGRRVSAFNGDFTNIGPGAFAGNPNVIQWNGNIEWTDKIEIMVANQAANTSGVIGPWFFEFIHAGGTLRIDSSNWTGHNSTDAEISAGTIPFFDFTSQLVSPLTRIRVSNGTGSQHAPSIGAVKADGKLLVDAIEDSQVWSNNAVTTGNSGNWTDLSNLFNGNLSNYAHANINASPVVVTLTFDPPLPATSGVKVYGGMTNSNVIWRVNDEANAPFNSANYNSVENFYSFTGDVSSITIGNSDGTNNSSGLYLYGVEVDGKRLIEPGIRDFGDSSLSSSIPYEKSLTFTDDTQLANMVGPIEMTDANGDVVTPVSDTIANVSGNTLTLASDTNLAYFQPGDEVQTGVQVVSVDEAAPSITVDGGSWYGADGTGGTYEISKSLRFNSADVASLSKEFSSAGNRKTWTWSSWVKISATGYHNLFANLESNTNGLYVYFYDNKLYIEDYQLSNGANLNVDASFGDYADWVHIVIAYDTTQANDVDRVKVYVNGEQRTVNGGFPAQNQDGQWNQGSRTHYIGRQTDSVTNYTLDAYLADVYFIDGQALAPTAFGKVDNNNVWQAKAASIPSLNNGTTWSSSSYNAVTGTTGSTDMTNAFDGDLSTFTSLGSGDGSTTATAVFTPPSPITVNTGVRVYIGVDRGQKISVNGSQTNASVSAGWNNVSFTGTLTSLSIGPTNAGSSSNIAAIEIDGVVLVDGATAYGTNGFHLDFSDSSSTSTLGYDANGTVTTGNSGPWASGFSSGTVSSGDTHSTNANTNTLNIDTAALGAYDITITKTGGANDIYLSTSDTNSGYNFLENNLTTVRITNTGTPSHSFSRWVQIAGSGGGNVTVSITGTANGTITGNNWTVNNLTATTSTATYNSTYGSGIIASQAEKVFDGDPSTYGVANSDFVGFNYSGTSLLFKIENSSSSDRYFLVQPWVSGTVSNSGTFGGQSVGTVSGNQWTIPANSTGTAVFTFPSGYDGYGRLFPSNSGADQRIYYMVAGPADGGDIDSLADTPTSNYATLNPLFGGQNSPVLSNGNLTYSHQTGVMIATMPFGKTGKWYFEVEMVGSNAGIGIALNGVPSNQYLGYDTNSWTYYSNMNNTSGGIYTNYNSNGTIIPYGSGYTSGDVIGVAFDSDTGELSYYKNGVSQGVAFTGFNDGRDYFPAVGSGSFSGNLNFGQRPFVYDAPSGYKALTTANMTEPTIKDGSKYFDTVTYSGTGGPQNIDGMAFSPDLVWIKTSSPANDHVLIDTVRGPGKRLFSNLTQSESDQPTSLSSFNSDGFTLGSHTSVNQASHSYVAWAWDAGDTTETIAVGGLNSSAYDQSQTWSTYGTFTGNFSQGGNIYNWVGVFNDGELYNDYGSMYLLDGTGKWTLTNPIACNSEVKFYMHTATSFTINEGLSDEITSTSTGSGYHYHSIPFTGDIASIKVNTAGTYLIRIFVDGKALIDPTISMPNVPSLGSQVRANPEAGFSIVTFTDYTFYTDYTLAHGLNDTPKFIIARDSTLTSQWAVYHSDLTSGHNLYLNQTAASGTRATGNIFVGDPTSSVFTYRSNNGGSPHNGVAYCFAPVEGYSAMGSYTGNGSTDGPFVYTGFKPAFLMIKNTGGDDWYIYDNERSNTKPLFPNGNYAEQPDDRPVEFLNNGFKIRYNQFFNATNANMIYMAFAEHPENTTPEVDTSGETQVALDPLAAIATDILEINGTTMYLNGATGPWRTGLSIEGSQINAAPPGPSEITFTSQNQGTPVFSGVDATLASRTWTLESGASATGPWTLVDTYSDFGVLNTQTGATPWTENKPTLQPNTYYRIKVQYNSTNADSVESVYNTFKTGDE